MMQSQSGNKQDLPVGFIERDFTILRCLDAEYFIAAVSYNNNFNKIFNDKCYIDI